MINKKIIIGSRGSKLALNYAEKAKNEIDLYIITSNGLPGKNKIVNKGQKIVKKRKFVFIKSIFAFTGFIFTLIGAFFWLIYPMLSLSIANESTAYEKSIAILYFDYSFLD